jgi:16S rRNA (guanine527-N7)-methyltransferase
VPETERDWAAALAPAIELVTGRQDVSVEVEQFRRYLDRLLDWNRTHRLTGLRSPAAIVRELFQDSLLFLTKLPDGPLAVADIGTGPGIPGVPLRIVRPQISLTLIESMRKRVSFLSSLTRDLGLRDVIILEGRAEVLVEQRDDLAGRFDVVVSRAVGLRVMPVVMRYLKPGGLFLAGGSPHYRAVTRIQPGIALSHERIPFPRLGLTRDFLISYKPA